MTEQEAIERCDRLINGFSVNDSTCDAFRDDEKGYPTFAKMKEFAEECKYALEEAQQLRNEMWELNQICRDYTSLGTVEELKEAKEKQIAKKPIPKKDVTENRIITYICPTCNRDYLGQNEYKLDYCEYCGQKLDWGNEDAE